jgi:hypothetical protein
MRLSFAVCGLILSLAPAMAEPSDSMIGSPGELAAARSVTVQLPPTRPLFTEARRDTGAGQLASDGIEQRPLRASVTTRMWISLGNGF